MRSSALYSASGRLRVDVTAVDEDGRGAEHPVLLARPSPTRRRRPRSRPGCRFRRRPARRRPAPCLDSGNPRARGPRSVQIRSTSVTAAPLPRVSDGRCRPLPDATTGRGTCNPSDEGHRARCPILCSICPMIDRTSSAPRSTVAVEAGRRSRCSSRSPARVAAPRDELAPELGEALAARRRHRGRGLAQPPRHPARRRAAADRRAPPGCASTTMDPGRAAAPPPRALRVVVVHARRDRRHRGRRARRRPPRRLGCSRTRATTAATLQRRSACCSAARPGGDAGSHRRRDRSRLPLAARRRCGRRHPRGAEDTARSLLDAASGRDGDRTADERVSLRPRAGGGARRPRPAPRADAAARARPAPRVAADRVPGDPGPLERGSPARARPRARRTRSASRSSPWSGAGSERQLTWSPRPGSRGRRSTTISHNCATPA